MRNVCLLINRSFPKYLSLDYDQKSFQSDDNVFFSSRYVCTQIGDYGRVISRPLLRKLRQTDRRTNQPTDRPTDGHRLRRQVTLSLCFLHLYICPTLFFTHKLGKNELGKNKNYEMIAKFKTLSKSCIIAKSCAYLAFYGTDFAKEVKIIELSSAFKKRRFP